METTKKDHSRGLEGILEGRDAVVEAGQAIPGIIQILHSIPTQYHNAIIDAVKQLLDISRGKEKNGGFGL